MVEAMEEKVLIHFFSRFRLLWSVSRRSCLLTVRRFVLWRNGFPLVLVVCYCIRGACYGDANCQTALMSHFFRRSRGASLARPDTLTDVWS